MILMHEFSLASSLIEYVSEIAKKNSLEKVSDIYIEVGEMTHIDARQLRFCLKVASQNTVAEKSKFHIKKSMPVLFCPKCNSTSKLKKERLISEYAFECPICGSQDVELKEGRELLLKRIKGVKKVQGTDHLSSTAFRTPS